MTDYHVILPVETFRVVNFQQENLPGIAVINESLALFEPKIVFSWHLLIIFEFDDLILNGMPSRSERDVIDPYGEVLDAAFKGDNPEKPNSLFLTRVTWNGTRELVYRVFDPEPINRYLVNIIKTKSYPKPFAYSIDRDPEWNLAKWHLGAGNRHA